MTQNRWISKLTKDFGVLASELVEKRPEPISVGSPSLNWALGVGGFIPGKINVLYGAESSGKTLLAMLAIIELQRKDPEAIAIWFDAEFSFSPQYFAKLGGDLNRLVVRRSNDPLKIFDYIGTEMLSLLQDGAPIRAIAIDSIRAIRYPGDVKEETTKLTMGGSGAKYLPSALKLIIPVIAEHNLLTFFIQQVAMQMDPQKALRNPYVVPDGKALHHCADTMLEVAKLDTKAGILESGETIIGSAAQIGHKVRIKVKKNRLAAPARIAQFSLNYDKGVVDTANEIFDLGKALGVICHPINPETKRENVQMWQIPGLDLVRGEANARAALANSVEAQKKVMEACYNVRPPELKPESDGGFNAFGMEEGSPDFILD